MRAFSTAIISTAFVACSALSGVVAHQKAGNGVSGHLRHGRSLLDGFSHAGSGHHLSARQATDDGINSEDNPDSELTESCLEWVVSSRLCRDMQ